MAAGDPYFNCDNSGFSMAQVLRKMISEDGNGNPVFNLSSTPTPTPTPFGDIFVENFNPQVGTYQDNGSASSVVTTGNMAISGGNGFFTNNVFLQDVVWNGNSWYTEHIFEFTNTGFGQFGTCFGFASINGAQQQNLFYGLYYAPFANKFQLDIFKSNTASGQLVSSDSVGQYLDVLPGHSVTVRADFTESTLVVTATNTTVASSVSVTYTWGYTLAATDIKPNTGKLIMLAPSSTINVKSYRFGSDYAASVERMFIGDSITSGYFGSAESNRFQNVYELTSGKSIATMAGAGDRTAEIVQALPYYTAFNPAKVHILIGTNDVANGVLLSTIQANINTIIAAFQAVGSSVYIGNLLPRNGQNNLPLNSFINVLTGVTVIDYYTAMEDTTPGDINPTYSDDGIHPNAAGMVFMKNLLIASGF